MTLARGADLDGIPSWGGNTPLEAASARETCRELLVSWLRAQGARSAGDES